jgi:hypothetical protein
MPRPIISGKQRFVIALAVTLVSGLLFAGCEKNKSQNEDTTSTSPQNDTTHTTESAEISDIDSTDSTALPDTYSGTKTDIGYTYTGNAEVDITINYIVVGDKSFKGITLTDVITDGTWMYQKFVVANYTFTAKQATDISRLDFAVYSEVNQSMSAYSLGDANFPNEDLRRNQIYENSSVPLQTGESTTLSLLMLVPTDMIASTLPVYLEVTPYVYGDNFEEQIMRYDISMFVK